MHKKRKVLIIIFICIKWVNEINNQLITLWRWRIFSLPNPMEPSCLYILFCVKN